MSPSEILLPRLEGVVSRGRNRWLARCPAHDDARPSLAIQEEDNGTVLIHCFAECPPLEVVNAVGLSLSDLFSQPIQYTGSHKPILTAKELLLVLGDAATHLIVAARDLANGKVNSEAEIEELLRIAARINRAKEIARVS